MLHHDLIQLKKLHVNAWSFFSYTKVRPEGDEIQLSSCMGLLSPRSSPPGWLTRWAISLEGRDHVPELWSHHSDCYNSILKHKCQCFYGQIMYKIKSVPLWDTL